MKFSIVIPNWNGRRLLEKNLPMVIKTKADEIIISDDGSSDDSLEFLKNNYPQLKVITNDHHGFARNCNIGVKAAIGDIVILLNSDVIPEKDFLKPLTDDFKDEKVFAVSMNEPQWSWALGKWHNGFIEHEPGKKIQKIHVSFWASGGSSAFRKKIWLELGGFDEIYKPFYWEDIDLSYRAQKRGYQIIWDPRSIVYHKHEATIKSNFSSKYVDNISQRNQLIFIWKNITDQKLFRQHIIGLISRLHQPGYFKIIISALIKLPKIIPQRMKEQREKIIFDYEIFNKKN